MSPFAKVACLTAYTAYTAYAAYAAPLPVLLPAAFAALCLVMSLICFAAFGIDKHRAVKGKYRVPEKHLLLLASLGGSYGALAAMAAFHHKTKKIKFLVLVPLFLVFQTAALLFLVFTSLN